MRIVYPRCCGLDVHKRSISACLLIPNKDGGTQQEIRRFGTVTRDLLELCDWLASNEVTHVARESTGVYWKPVWNILEANFTILLVNAQHVKAVPGRKTDAKDCQWIADLLQHGLLKGSFIPPSPIRELRDLTRTRASLRQDHIGSQSYAKDSRRRQCQIGVGSYRLVGRVRESYREPHVGR